MPPEPWQREPFIPIRNSEILPRLTADCDLDPEVRAGFAQFCNILAATLHDEFHRCLTRILDRYAEFDPDSDVQTLAQSQPEARRVSADRLCQELRDLLRQGHFRTLDRQAIEDAAEAVSDWGVRLRVDFDVFEQLEVHGRGDVVHLRERRSWRTWWRPEVVEVPVYQKLVVLFKLREGQQLGPNTDDRSIHLKLFKNIPKLDLDMLLPSSQVQMTWFDRGKILVPTVSGLTITFYKLMSAGLILAFASIGKFLGFLGLVGGSIGYGIKSFLGFVRTRDKYHLHLTRSLYYQNLDNNAGVLLRIVHEAECQEFREAILAWWFLWRQARPEGLSVEELDECVEAWLMDQLKTEIDFDVSDGIGKLQRWGLVETVEADRYRAVPLADAIARLDQQWDGRSWDE